MTDDTGFISAAELFLRAVDGTIGSITGVAATMALVGAFAGIIGQSRSSKESRSNTKNFEMTNNIRIDSRLGDITAEFDRNRNIYRWSSWAATLLTISQFIVGGALASSFIQESLTSNVVGLLGVLVLLSSLIHQRFRPDLHAAQARQRMYKSRRLIRSIEDDLFAITNNMPSAPSIFDVRSKASNGLIKLEDVEIDGLIAITAKTDLSGSEDSPTN